MANRLTTEILINLAGNLTAKARQYGANMSEFARTNQRAMSVVKATSAAAGRALDSMGNRYTAAIAGFGGSAMLKNFATTDRRMTRLGITAGKTKEEINAVFSDVQDLSIKARIDDKELVSFMETVTTMTGDIAFGIKNKETAALAIAGTGASGESIGALYSQFLKYGVNNEKDSTQALDLLNRLGKEGAYELKDLAEKAGPALSLYAAAGGHGIKGIKDVGVLMESARDTTGNRDTAATLVENFIREIQDPKIAKALREKGVNTKDANGQLKSLPDLVLALAQGSMRGAAKRRAAGDKDASALGELQSVGFTQTSLDLISGASSKKGQENIQRYNAVVADGKSIQEDAAYAAQDFTSAMQSLATTLEKFANKNLAKPIQELADVINNLDPKVVQEWLEFGKNVAISIGGIIAARKAFKFGKDIWDMFSPGKGKGIPGDVADVFGSGVMPVYVTNWPADGVGGKGENKVDDLLDASSDLPGWPGMLARGGLIISKLMGLTGMDPFSDEGRNELLKRVQQNNERSTMWDDLKNWLDSSSQSPAGYQDPSPWASMQPQNQPGYPFLQQPELKGSIEVSVKDDRVQVTSVKVNAPGVTLSAQSGVSNVEQD
ncbi:phage tail tape measure protein [Raoultella planticola]|uniref:phage tail tape measure protein n=1 Tax=Raoultella planticola TaxID=575 RepID=UPI0007EB2F93|nr:phage tail tape measure protein [Raoultella planticola]OAZ78119.1 phage tail protein [Raoultella planticola]OAZ81102.1 phage tail protein [Raoultella planticola]